MRSAERRVSGKRKLGIRRENTHAVVRRRVCWLENEGSFRKIGPARHGPHLCVTEIVGIENHGQRIPFQGNRRENINLFETARLRHEESFLNSALRALFYD